MKLKKTVRIVLSVIMTAAFVLAISKGLRAAIIQSVENHVVHHALNEEHWQEFILQNTIGMMIVCIFLLVSLCFVHEVRIVWKRKYFIALAVICAVFVMSNFSHILSAFLFMAAFYALCFVCLRCGGGAKTIPCRIQCKVILLVVLVSATLFALYWARANNTIYAYDWGDPETKDIPLVFIPGEQYHIRL